MFEKLLPPAVDYFNSSQAISYFLVDDCSQVPGRIWKGAEVLCSVRIAMLISMGTGVNKRRRFSGGTSASDPVL